MHPVRRAATLIQCGICFTESTGDLFMNLTISGHHLEVTPALRNYVTTKLDPDHSPL